MTCLFIPFICSSENLLATIGQRAYILSPAFSSRHMVSLKTFSLSFFMCNLICTPLQYDQGDVLGQYD